MIFQGPCRFEKNAPGEATAPNQVAATIGLLTPMPDAQPIAVYHVESAISLW